MADLQKLAEKLAQLEPPADEKNQPDTIIQNTSSANDARITAYSQMKNYAQYSLQSAYNISA